jgi:hypothetical protein
MMAKFLIKESGEMDKYSIPGVTTFEYAKIIGAENIEFGHHVFIADFAFMLMFMRAGIEWLLGVTTLASQIPAA